MKSVLLNANNDGGLESRFQVALDVARAFDSHLSCIQIIPFQVLVTGEVFMPAYGAANVYDAIVEQGEKHQAEMEGRLRLENVPWDWLRCDGDAAQAIIDQSGLIDLVVISTSSGAGRGADADLGAAGAICTQARGPILAVPLDVKAFNPFGTALIAWNGSLEGANAVRLALPMLAKAAAVHILTVAEDTGGFPATDVCQYLARHGIGAELHTRGRKAATLADGAKQASVADIIMETARSLSADYILAGAYGHSRFREAMFGGVTRDLLKGSELPLLLAH